MASGCSLSAPPRASRRCGSRGTPGWRRSGSAPRSPPGTRRSTASCRPAAGSRRRSARRSAPAQAPASAARAPRADIWWPKRSRTEARATTCPALPPSACTNRASVSTQMLGASAQAIAPATKIATPFSSGARRPMRSDSGPQNSCPTPSPAKNAASVTVTDPAALQPPRDRRQARQIHVDRQRPERRQAAEQQHQRPRRFLGDRGAGGRRHGGAVAEIPPGANGDRLSSPRPAQAGRGRADAQRPAG